MVTINVLINISNSLFKKGHLKDEIESESDSHLLTESQSNKKYKSLRYLFKYLTDILNGLLIKNQA